MTLEMHLPTAASAEHRQVSRRLLVSLQDEASRGYHPLGFLDCLVDGRFRFAYLQRAVDEPSFQPLLGLPNTGAPVVAAELFPLFANQVMSARRPDRTATLGAVDLPGDAAPFEVLARLGVRAGDLLQVTEVPRPGVDGRVSMAFLVHGIRYQGPEAVAAIDELRPGDLLELVADDAHPADPQAVGVHRRTGLRLGFVPRPLTEVVRNVMRGDPGHRIQVVRRNAASVGFHLRLLVRLDGYLTQNPFAGSAWTTVGSKAVTAG